MTNYFLPDDKNSTECLLFKVLYPLGTYSLYLTVLKLQIHINS